MHLGIGGMETDAGRREHVALGADEHGARRQFCGDFHALTRMGQDVDARKPIGKHDCQARIGTGHVVGQALQSGGRGLVDHCMRGHAVKGKLARRRF